MSSQHRAMGNVSFHLYRIVTKILAMQLENLPNIDINLCIHFMHTFNTLIE